MAIKKSKYNLFKISIFASILIGLLFICFMLLVKNYLDNPPITAQEVLKKNFETYRTPEKIRHAKSYMMQDGKNSVWEEWHENDSKKRKTIIMNKDEGDLIQVFDLDHYWDVNFKKKIYKKSNLEYVNVEDRNYKLPYNPYQGLLDKENLIIKRAFLDWQIVYVIFEDENYKLYFDSENYGLLKEEYHTLENGRRVLYREVRMKEEVIQRTEENLRQIFSSAPEVREGFKVCEGDFLIKSKKDNFFLGDDCYVTTNLFEVSNHMR